MKEIFFFFFGGVWGMVLYAEGALIIGTIHTWCSQ